MSTKFSSPLSFRCSSSHDGNTFKRSSNRQRCSLFLLTLCLSNGIEGSRAKNLQKRKNRARVWSCAVIPTFRIFDFFCFSLEPVHMRLYRVPEVYAPGILSSGGLYSFPDTPCYFVPDTLWLGIMNRNVCDFWLRVRFILGSILSPTVSVKLFVGLPVRFLVCAVGLEPTFTSYRPILVACH